MAPLAKVVDFTPPLRRLAEQIAREHGLVEKHKRAAVDHARRAGTLLIEAKRAVAYGEWESWLAGIGLASRTAQLYMAIARRWPEIERSATVADLTVRECQRLLAAVPALQGKPVRDVSTDGPRQLLLIADCNPTPRIDEAPTRTIVLRVPVDVSDQFRGMVSRLGIAMSTSTITATILALVRRASADLPN